MINTSPDYMKMYAAEKEAKEFYIERCKTLEVTLRDQIAMAALPSIIMQKEDWNVFGQATEAYYYADSMLKARKED